MFVSSRWEYFSTIGMPTSDVMEYHVQFLGHIPCIKLGSAGWTISVSPVLEAMFWKRSYLWRPGFLVKPVVLPYSFIVAILFSWKSSVICRDVLNNSVGSYAPSAAVLIDAVSLLRGSSARSILLVGGSVTRSRPHGAPSRPYFTVCVSVVCFC